MDDLERINVLLFMTEDQRGFFFRQTPILKSILASVTVLIWISGLLMKSVILKFTRQVKFSERPINVLIVVGLIVDTFSNTLIIMAFLAVAIWDMTLYQLLNRTLRLDISGNDFCWAYCYIVHFWLSCYNNFELSISLFRIMLVKGSNLIKKVEGKKIILTSLILVSCIASGINTHILAMGKVFGRTAYNQCQGTTDEFQVSQNAHVRAYSDQLQRAVFDAALCSTQQWR